MVEPERAVAPIVTERGLTLRAKLMFLVAVALLPSGALIAYTAAETRHALAAAGDVARADLMFMRNLAALWVLSVLAFGLAWIVSEEVVVRPLNAILRATRRLSSGDLSARTEVREGGGELGELAQAFDEMAASLERQKEALLEVDRLKTRILNAAAHELNTPLTPMKLQLHLLKSVNADGMSARQQKAIGVIDRNVDRLALLVEDMLDVARLQSGRLKLTMESVRVDELARDAVDAFQENAKRAGVVMDVRASHNLVVQGDDLRLMQVLYNLLGNALKFTPTGGHVRVEAVREHDDAVVRVTDTGMGLSPDQRARLFQPFSRVHESDEKAPGGTGLGLFITKGIVEEHGGRIWAVSDGAKRGSTFAFAIPVARGVRDVVDAPAADAPAEA